MQPGLPSAKRALPVVKTPRNILFKNLSISTWSVLFSSGSVGFGHVWGAMVPVSSVCPTSAIFSFYTNAAGLPTEGFLMFETVFCATSATIVSGAMAERTKFSMYCIYSFFISLIIYPVEGHWTWGGGWLCNADAGSFMMNTFSAAFQIS